MGPPYPPTPQIWNMWKRKACKLAVSLCFGEYILRTDWYHAATKRVPKWNPKRPKGCPKVVWVAGWFLELPFFSPTIFLSVFWSHLCDVGSILAPTGCWRDPQIYVFQRKSTVNSKRKVQERTSKDMIVASILTAKMIMFEGWESSSRIMLVAIQGGVGGMLAALE